MAELKKKLIFILICLIFISLAANSCKGVFVMTPNSEAETSEKAVSSSVVAKVVAEPEPEAPPAIELNLAVQFAADSPRYRTCSLIAREYQEKRPNVSIKISSIAEDEARKAAFASGDVPDICFLYDGEFTDKLAAKNTFVTLEEITARKQEYISGPLETLTDSGYALPIISFWEGLYVNVDLFKIHHVPLPDSYEKFVNAVTYFAATDIAPVSVSFLEMPHYLVENMILSAGSSEEYAFLPENGGQIPGSWALGLDGISALYEDRAFPPGIRYLSEQDALSLFADKQAAMRFDGSWLVGSLAGKEGVKVFPIYKMSGAGTKDLLGECVNGFYISRGAWEDAAKWEAAAGFVMELTGAENLGRFADTGGYVQDKKSPPGTVKLIQSGAEMFAGADSVNIPISLRTNSSMWTYVLLNIPGIADGTVKTAEVLQRMQVSYGP